MRMMIVAQVSDTRGLISSLRARVGARRGSFTRTSAFQPFRHSHYVGREVCSFNGMRTRWAQKASQISARF